MVGEPKITVAQKIMQQYNNNVTASVQQQNQAITSDIAQKSAVKRETDAKTSHPMISASAPAPGISLGTRPAVTQPAQQTAQQTTTNTGSAPKQSSDNSSPTGSFVLVPSTPKYATAPAAQTQSDTTTTTQKVETPQQQVATTGSHPIIRATAPVIPMTQKPQIDYVEKTSGAVKKQWSGNKNKGSGNKVTGNKGTGYNPWRPSNTTLLSNVAKTIPTSSSKQIPTTSNSTTNNTSTSTKSPSKDNPLEIKKATLGDFLGSNKNSNRRL